LSDNFEIVFGINFKIHSLLCSSFHPESD